MVPARPIPLRALLDQVLPVKAMSPAYSEREIRAAELRLSAKWLLVGFHAPTGWEA